MHLPMKGMAMRRDVDIECLEENLHKRSNRLKEQCTFEAHQRSQSFYAPLGGALVVLSLALLHFGALVPFNFGIDGLVKILSKELIETDYAQTHVFAMLLLRSLEAGPSSSGSSAPSFRRQASMASHRFFIQMPIWRVSLLIGRAAFVAHVAKRCGRELRPLLQ